MPKLIIKVDTIAGPLEIEGDVTWNNNAPNFLSNGVMKLGGSSWACGAVSIILDQEGGGPSYHFWSSRLGVPHTPTASDSTVRVTE